jgi:hypothetical protein
MFVKGLAASPCPQAGVVICYGGWRGDHRCVLFSIIYGTGSLLMAT